MNPPITGAVPRVDLTPITALFDPLLTEWSELRFASDGAVLNPVTGAPLRTFSLVSGTHRQVGARYALVLEEPVMELPDHLVETFDAEAERLRRERAESHEWLLHDLERRSALVQVGVFDQVTEIELLRDDRTGLGMTVSRPDPGWTFDLVVLHGPMPRVEVRVPLAEDCSLGRSLADAGLGRWVGPGELRAELDLGALERSGLLAEASGQLGDVSATAACDVDARSDTWHTTTRLDVTVRTGSRLLAARRTRRANRVVQFHLKAIGALAVEFFDNRAGDELDAMADQMEQMGAARLVRGLLWEDGFAEELEHRFAREDVQDPSDSG